MPLIVKRVYIVDTNIAVNTGDIRKSALYSHVGNELLMSSNHWLIPSLGKSFITWSSPVTALSFKHVYRLGNHGDFFKYSAA